MDKKIETAVAGTVAPKIASGFRLRWLVYGAAAYFGLRYLNKRGILPKQTGKALDAIDRGVDRGIEMAKERIGWNSDLDSAVTSTVKKNVGEIDEAITTH